MTKERLEAYRSCKDEIAELTYLLEHLGEGDSLMDNDVIFDYTTGYPRPQSVVGFDQKKYDQKRERYLKRKVELVKECEEIEAFVEAILDSLTRRIFRMYFLQGMNQEKVAKRVHIARSQASKKIDKYLQLEHKEQKEQL